MAEFKLHIVMPVSTTITVEAETLDDALDTYEGAPEIPGTMAYGAFGSSSVDEAGEWEAVAAYEGDELVWERGDRSRIGNVRELVDGFWATDEADGFRSAHEEHLAAVEVLVQIRSILNQNPR